MIKVKKKTVKRVYPNRNLYLGRSFYVDTINRQHLFIDKTNWYGKTITILLAPYYIILEGIIEYKDTLKYVFNFKEVYNIPQEQYDALTIVE